MHGGAQLVQAAQVQHPGGRAEAREIESSDRAVAQALLRAIGAVENRARSRPFSDPDGELPAPLSKLQTRSWACASQGSEHVPRRFAAALGPSSRCSCAEHFLRASSLGEWLTMLLRIVNSCDALGP
jgi:hypothetical protein